MLSVDILCDDISMYMMSCVLWRKGFLWIKIADQQRKVVFSSESSNQGVSNTFLQMTGPHPYITCLLSTYEPFFFSVIGAWNQRRVSPVGTSSLL